MWAAVMTALKAIAALPEILTQFKDAYVSAANRATEARIAEIKEELNEITQRLPDAQSREEIADLVRRLNSTISK